MTDEQINAIAAADGACLLLINCLTRHLITKGVIEGEAFTTYLHRTADRLETESDDQTIRIFRSMIAGLTAERPPAPRLQ